MSITIKYFASLREQMGKADDSLDYHEGITIASLWNKIHSSEIPTSILAAINMEYASLTDPVKDGDEVAFFPPVTGG